MEDLADNTNESIEERLLFALIEENENKFPEAPLSPGLQSIILEYFRTAMNIGATNITEQAMEYLGALGSSNPHVRKMRKFLKKTDFEYKVMNKSTKDKSDE